MKKVLLATIITASSFLVMPLKSHGMTFNFKFTNDGDFFPETEIPEDLLISDVVGTGTFSFDGDPGDGEFALDSLPNYNFEFNLGNETFTFTNEDIDTPTEEVLVLISTIDGSNRRVQFSNTQLSPSGIAGGSIDFLNLDESLLTFEPPFLGKPEGENPCLEIPELCTDTSFPLGGEPAENLNLYQANNSTEETSFFGTYIGTTQASLVPESSNNLSLLLLGSLGFSTILIRRYK